MRDVAALSSELNPGALCETSEASGENRAVSAEIGQHRAAPDCRLYGRWDSRPLQLPDGTRYRTVGTARLRLIAACTASAPVNKSWCCPRLAAEPVSLSNDLRASPAADTEQ